MSVELLGRCGRVINEKNEDICNNVATMEVLVRTKFSLVVVRLCEPCGLKHRRFYRRYKADQARRNAPIPTGG